MRTTVILIGGIGEVYGGKLCRDLRAGRLEAASLKFLRIDTDREGLGGAGADSLLIGEKSLNGSGTHGDHAAGVIAVEESGDEILEKTGDADRYILLFSALGGTGGGAGPCIAKALKEQRKHVEILLFMPYSFERPLWDGRADNVREKVRELCVDAYFIDNDFLLNMGMGRRMTKKEAEEYIYTEIVRKAVKGEAYLGADGNGYLISKNRR